MTEIISDVFRNEEGWGRINSIISANDYSSIYILVDNNTQFHCLSVFMKKLDNSFPYYVLEIPSGEKHKNIDTCIGLWQQLSIQKADKHCLLINLGGGMITDLGGFVASTFKRGVDFINIPTTLLAMVDASIGGKNGIDFGYAKNQVGTITQPKAVVIDTEFLKTLPKRELISGMAEMLKHSLIQSDESWQKIKSMNVEDPIGFEELIWDSISIKDEIVIKDPLESNLRKTLNYGHTLGHAIESYCLSNNEREALLHGEAIAIGIILATFISNQLLGFPKEKVEEVSSKILSLFPKKTFTESEIDSIVDLLLFDKKNRNGRVLFVLLEDIGKPKINCIVNNDLICKAFDYYKYL